VAGNPRCVPKLLRSSTRRQAHPMSCTNFPSGVRAMSGMLRATDCLTLHTRGMRPRAAQRLSLQVGRLPDRSSHEGKLPSVSGPIPLLALPTAADAPSLHWKRWSQIKKLQATARPGGSHFVLSHPRLVTYILRPRPAPSSLALEQFRTRMHMSTSAPALCAFTAAPLSFL